MVFFFCLVLFLIIFFDSKILFLGGIFGLGVLDLDVGGVLGGGGGVVLGSREVNFSFSN